MITQWYIALYVRPCIPIRSNSKILLTSTFHFGSVINKQWWGGRLYRKIGDENYSELTDANNISTDVRKCFISSNWGMDNDNYFDQYIKNDKSKIFDF